MGSGRLVWLRLNADGVLIAVLAMLAGFDLFQPELEDVVREAGFIPPTFYIWTMSFVLGGLCMMIGFLWRVIHFELLGRLLVVLAWGIETWRTALIFGALDEVVVKSYFIGAALLVTFTVRASALLSPHGLAVVIGSRNGVDDALNDHEGQR